MITYRALNHNSQPLEGTSCRHFCPQGNKCCLDGKVPHTYHICPSPGCFCHSERRYAGNKVAKHDNPGQAHKSAVSHREATPPTASAHPAAGDRHARETEGGTR